MFSKLALRNVRRSFRDYGVYLLTLTFGVCLFYTFNSIDGQGVMVYLAQSQNPMAQMIQTILDIFSVFVAVVLACLILYANTFLIRRRKRELGIYLLLGLSQRQVSGLLVLETLVIGLISLAAGLLLGLAASQGLSALTLSMFSIRVDAFALAFSPRAAVRTVGYFGLIFLLVMVFSGIQVSRARLIDLMQGERKNEELRERPLGLAVVQFVLGAVCLAAAYAICRFVEPEAEALHFQTLSGPLTVRRRGELFELDLPAYPLKQLEVTDQIVDALGARPREVWRARDLVCVFDDPRTVMELKPDLDKVKALKGALMQVTAPGTGTAYDCVSRPFAPKMGLPEDPVCGSGHCHIVPYWAQRLGKRELTARQASPRGGTLYCRLEGDRVLLAGRAALFSTAELMLEGGEP